MPCKIICIDNTTITCPPANNPVTPPGWFKSNDTYNFALPSPSWGTYR